MPDPLSDFVLSEALGQPLVLENVPSVNYPVAAMGHRVYLRSGNVAAREFPCKLLDIVSISHYITYDLPPRLSRMENR